MIRRFLKSFARLVISLAVLAGVAAGGYYGFHTLKDSRESHKDKEHDHAERPPVPIRVAKAEKRSLQPGFEVIGIVLADPEKQATLTAATNGLVDSLCVREGAQIGKGKPVILLDERKARIDLDRAESTFARLVAKPRPEELAQAEALVTKAKVAYNLAANRYAKSVEIRKRSPEIVPEVQLLDDQRAEQVALADVKTAEAQLELLKQGPREETRREARVELDAMKLQLDFCRVTAPFDGEVVELLARVGMKADVGTPLARVLNTSVVLVQGRIPGNRLPGIIKRFQPGAPSPVAMITSASFPVEQFPAESGWLNQQTEALTADVPLKLRVLNAKGLLRVGLSVQISLQEPAVEGLAIPEAAITVNEEGHHVVTLIRDGKAQPTEIEITSATEPEIRADGWVRVLKGLQAGDEVAIENGYALPKDTPVEILPPKAPPAEEKH